MKHPIETITIMLNKACNLRCDYCFINKNETNATAQINKELIELIHNGYYIERLNEEFPTQEEKANIKRMDFWGGEPTLNPDEMLLAFEQMSSQCPNLTGINFSTNFALPGADQIFIKIYKGLLKHHIANHKTDPYEINMQISIDGPGTITNRNRGDSVAESIATNFANLCENMKSVFNRDRVRVNIHTHGVVDSDTIEALTTFEGIKNYWDYFAGLEDSLIKSGFQGASICTIPGSAMMFPTPETSETGKTAAKMFQALYEFYTGENPGYSKIFWDRICSNMPGDMTFRYDIGRKIENRIGEERYIRHLKELREEILTHNIVGEPDDRTYCGQTFGCTVLTPDHEWALCQNCFFDRYDSYMDAFANSGKTNNRFITNEHADYKKNSKNWIWRDEESYRKFQRVVATAYENASSGAYFGNEVLTRTMIRTMARAGIIDPKYKDPKECNYAAKYVDPSVNCMSIMLTVTGSIYLPAMYYLPLYLNGAMDWIDKLMLLRIEKELRHHDRQR